MDDNHKDSTYNHKTKNKRFDSEIQAMTYVSTNPIKTEQRRIQRLIDLSRIVDDSRKPGSISLERRGNTMYCYESSYENGKRVRRRYLGRPNSDAVRRYCSLRFREELSRRLLSNQKLLQKLEASYLECDPASVYAAMPTSCPRISSEIFVDERYENLKAWAAADYQKNSMPFPKVTHYAKDGTRVRSKGECIVYNLLLERGIPLRYDSLLTFYEKRGFSKMLSPDFLIQCYDGSFVIIEHLGYIGDKNYAIDYGEKCYWYLHEGFVPGKNFLVTSDDINGGTDSHAIMSVVSRVEQLFWGY